MASSALLLTSIAWPSAALAVKSEIKRALHRRFNGSTPGRVKKVTKKPVPAVKPAPAVKVDQPAEVSKPLSSSTPVVAPGVPLTKVEPVGILKEAVRSFPKITFTEAIRRALTKSTNVLVSLQEIKHAAALLTEARAQALPSLVAGGVYSYLDNDRVFAGKVISAQSQRSGTLTVNVPIFMPARLALWVHAAEALEIAHLSAKEVRRQIALLTGRSYLGVLMQKHMLQVNESARDTAKEHFTFAASRFQGGVGNLLDELRARQELSLNEAQVENAKLALLKAREALGILVGSDEPLDVDLEEDFHYQAPTSTSIELKESEIARRPDVKSAQKNLLLTERIRRDSWLDWLPTLTGTMQGFYQDPPTLVMPKTGWQAQLVLSLPIFEGGVRVGQLKERQAAKQIAELKLAELLRQVSAEIRLAYEAVRRAEIAYDKYKEASNEADKSLVLANEAYAAGATTNIEVVDAERRAKDAAIAVVMAEDSMYQARLDLLAATARFPDDLSI